jgi:DNA-binding FadR family transcriptional regulator
MASDDGSNVPDGGGADLFLQPVAAKNPFEEAFTQLARSIRLGAVKVGEKFPPERVLSERLKVSRTTVREAIRGLEQSGYIVTRRGRYGGTFVLRDEPLLPTRGGSRKIGPEILTTLDFRAAIEPGAVALAALKAREDDVRALRELEAELTAGGPDSYLRDNCRLHILFARVADCEPLLQAITALELEIMDAFMGTPDLNPSEVRSHPQHHVIIDAIAAGKGKKAREAMEEHLAGTDLLMRELVASRRHKR